MTGRLATMPNAPARYRDDVVRRSGGHARWTGRVVFDAAALDRIVDGLIDAAKPRRVFLNSMSDTFHDLVPSEAGQALARAIFTIELGARRDDHVLMLLTKRPENARAWQRKHYPDGLPPWVWIGTTAGTQATADERIPVLLDIAVQPGGVRFVSVEPMLGPVSLLYAAFSGGSFSAMEGIRWVIVGCESGDDARPCDDNWIRAIRDDCEQARVPFFLKQRAIPGRKNRARPVIDGSGELDGRVHREVPSCRSTR